MVQKASPKASRKLKDKWKLKGWYSIVAPEMFNRAKIGETLSDEPEKLKGRIVEVTAQDLTGDFTKMHIKLHFKVDDVKGEEASTLFYRLDLTSDYIRRLARRKRTRIEDTFDIETRDKAMLRIRPVAITEHRIASSKQSIIRRLMGEELKKIAGETLLNDFIKGIISGQIPKRVAQACKSINIINRVEIRKTEFLAQEEVEDKGTEEEKVDLEPEAPPEEEEPEEPKESEKPEEPEVTPEPEEPKESEEPKEPEESKEPEETPPAEEEVKEA